MNLSDKVLIPHHLSGLSKGLSFVPSYQTNSFEMKTDLFLLFRKIKQEILEPFTSVPYYPHYNLSKEETL